MISYAIQHHESRRDLIPPLLEVIPSATVAVDPEPDTNLNWPTARIAWSSYRTDATHHCVLEDDAVPCRHFVQALEAAVEARPTSPILLWANTKRMREAYDRGDSWIRAAAKWHGSVGVVMPRGWIEAFIEYGDGEQFGGRPSVDWRMRLFFQSIRQRPFITVPNLVQHGAPAESILWRRGGILNNRVSDCFADDLAHDIRRQDWNIGVGRPAAALS